jgi:hypothetical protein
MPADSTRWWERLNKKLITEIVGCVLVALGVTLELYAEGKRAGVETKLRANNAATQAELNTRANNATAAAVKIADEVGGLDVLVRQTGDKIEALTKNSSNQKAQAASLIAALTAKQAEVTTTIEEAQKEVAALAASLDTINDLRQQIHEQSIFRTLTKPQIDTLGPFLKAKLQPDPKTMFPTVGIAAIFDTEAQAYAYQFMKLFKDNGVWYFPTPNGDDPRQIAQLVPLKVGLVLVVGSNGTDKSVYGPFLELQRVMKSVGLDSVIEQDPKLKFEEAQLDVDRKPAKE